jgi:16S rRNA (uracil1498-N3)-methyltransferase
MSRRFFSETPITGPVTELTGAEAQHLAKVMRAKAGDEVILFDGTGFEFAAEVMAVARASVSLRITERCEVDRELPFEWTLAVALPKGDRQRWLVEKLVELGCTRLQPIVTARGVAQPTGNALARLERAVIEACKQCGRNRLMQIAPSQALTELLTSADKTTTRLLAHPAGDVTNFEQARRPGAKTIVAIGPEGGFAPEELSLAEAQQWSLLNLGPRILRTETAAIVCASLLACQRVA